MKKIALLVSGFWFLVSCCSGQEIEWQNTIGGDTVDFLYSVQQTSDEGYILGGYSLSNISGDKTENSNGNYDYWIVKTDSSGNIQWQNTIGGNDLEFLLSVQQTTDGGYILGGYSSSDISGDKTENSNGSWDYWIVKTDAAGTIQWQNTIGGNNQEILHYVQQTPEGGYILAGISNSNISGDKTENSNGSADYWIVKTDSSGNIQWQNTIGGNQMDDLSAFHQTSDSGYVIGGYSYSNISGDKTENNNGAIDCWIVKINSSGNIQWQNTIGGSNDEYIGGITQTTDGGYILGMFSNSNISGDKTENSNGSYDYWIVKTDVGGNFQWQNTIGGSGPDYLNSIQQTVDGGFILGGISPSNISGDKTENSNGSVDFWVVKTDAAGIIDWQNSIGGTNYDYLNCILQTNNGAYIAGGYSHSDISGDKSENSNGNADYWIVKLTEKLNTITGKLFIDSNSNGVPDPGEPPLNHRPISELNSGKFTFSQITGMYNLNVLDTGNFMVTSSLNYYNQVPVNHLAYFTSFYQTDSLNDFAFQPTGIYNDLCITITPGIFRENRDANYMINYENAGTTTLNGTVIFFPDSDVTYVSANPTATFVTTDSIVWIIGTLTPFQTGSILVTVHVNAGTPIGTIINSSVRIEPVAGDANTVCNYNTWEAFVTAAVDPNAILVDRDTVLTTELSSPPYLNYIIYFQNTGNDTAFNARVLNNIPQMLDVNSFEFVAASHPMNITYGAHARLMTFTFDNILLPDSNVNEPGSHGFIRYRIKPLSTLAAGDSIKNNAAIYFDFNQPVMTDTAVTEIVLPTGSPTLTLSGGEGIVLAPNPVTDELTISVKPLHRALSCPEISGSGGGLVGLYIYDLFGRIVFQLQTSNFKLQTKIDVSRFSNGIYFVEIIDAKKSYLAKFVKE